MALMKMTGMAGVSSFSRASVMTPVWVSQRAPAGTVLAVTEGMGWRERGLASDLHACGVGRLLPLGTADDGVVNGDFVSEDMATPTPLCTPCLARSYRHHRLHLFQSLIRQLLNFSAGNGNPAETAGADRPWLLYVHGGCPQSIQPCCTQNRGTWAGVFRTALKGVSCVHTCGVK